MKERKARKGKANRKVRVTDLELAHCSENQDSSRLAIKTDKATTTSTHLAKREYALDVKGVLTS
jgi:hypothetical protein